MINLTRYEDPITPEPGIYKNVPWTEYCMWNAFSKSMVSSALRSGLHLKHFIDNGKESPSLTLGTLVDCLLFEPNEFENRFVLQPETYDSEVTKGRGENKVTTIIQKPWNMRSNTCKAFAEEVKYNGKQLIDRGYFDKSNKMVNALRDSRLNKLFNDTESQVSVCWIEPNTGVLCKSRLDMLNGTVISDLKTTRDASPYSFARDIDKFGYHVQAAVYSDAMEFCTGEKHEFNLIVVENGDVPGVAHYQVTGDTLLAGRLKFQRACQRVAEYSQFGFRGYLDVLEPISIPKYAIDNEFYLHEEIEV